MSKTLSADLVSLGDIPNSQQLVPLSVDPTAGGGVAAPVGSLGLLNLSGVGFTYVKSGAANTAWELLSTLLGTNVFVFRPGGTASGNVFTSWATLMAAVGALAGQRFIEFDGGGVGGSVTIPTGSWNMADVTWIGANGYTTTINNATGVAFVQLRSIGANVRIVWNNTNSAVADLATGDQFVIDGHSSVTSSGSVAFLDVTNSDVNVSLRNGVTLVTGATAAITSSTGNAYNISAGTNVLVQANTLAASSAIVLQAAYDATSASISLTQTGITSTGGSINIGVNTFGRVQPLGPLTSGALLNNANSIVEVNPTGGSFVITLPGVAAFFGQTIIIKNVSTSTNTVTVTAASGDTIDGSPTVLMNMPMGVIELVSDGVHTWDVVQNTASATEYDVFVFAPSIAVPTGNVFNTWKNLYVAVTAGQGRRYIEFAPDSTGACQIPSGSWDMTDVVWIGTNYLTSATVTEPYYSPVTVEEGATFTNLREIGAGLDITVASTATVAVNDFNPGDFFTFDGQTRIGNTGAAAFIDVLSSGATIQFLNGAVLFAGAHATITSSTAGNYTIETGVDSIVNSNTLSMTGAGVVTWVNLASSGSMSELQTGVTAGGGSISTSFLTLTRFNPILVTSGPGTVDVFPGQCVMTDATSNAVNLRLPPAFDNRGKEIIIKNTNIAGTNFIGVTPTAGDNIDGGTSAIQLNLSDYQSLTLMSDGAHRWMILAKI